MNIFKGKKIRRGILALLTAVIVMASIVELVPDAFGDTDIHMIIDGRDVSASAEPVIQNGRTLVPLRFVSEQLGAEVTWNDADRSISVTRGDRTVLLMVDRNFIKYTVDGEKSFGLCDVTPQLLHSKTFVPLRLIGNALGVGTDWDAATRTITIDSEKTSDIVSFFSMKITSVQAGATITGTTSLSTSLPSPVPAGTAEIRYFAVDPDSGSGFVIAKGTNTAGTYQWLPSTRDNGEKVLVAALYDSSGRFLAGDAIPVEVGIKPQAVLTGLAPNQTVNAAVSLGTKLNFAAAYVKYKITNTDNGKVTETSEQDPTGYYTWTPQVGYNGNVTVMATAFDQKGVAYPGEAVPVTVAVQSKLALLGVKSGQTINGSVTLSASRNFDVTSTEYFAVDSQTGTEQSLQKIGYGSYTWFPGPSFSGNKKLYVRVTGTDGTVYTSDGIPVYVSGTPKLLLKGAGPDQVITSAAPAKLKVSYNVALSSVKYIMTNTATGAQRTIASFTDASQGYTYTPVQGDHGTWNLKAVGTYGSGQTLSTDAVKVTVYTGKLYSAKPIIEKSKFQGMASQLALADAKKSGQSAALQTAQAILESGWGQSVPVDKYSGKLSYNLFGIKGSGSAGSVISGTWEEYNGARYNIDAKFRAYNGVSGSWTDHNKLLLTVSRYQPYRAVMYDSSLGAWALKRCGYATDSAYPVKLIALIEKYGLEELDRVKI